MTHRGRGHRHRRSPRRSRPRRAGDPDRIVASGELAARDLDWEMRHTLEDMVQSAWEARQAAVVRPCERFVTESGAS